MTGELAHLNPTPKGDKVRGNILDFIAAHVEKHGYPPTVREIGEAVGLASPATVHAHLTRLSNDGRLFRDPTKPRAIRVLTGGDDAA